MFVVKFCLVSTLCFIASHCIKETKFYAGDPVCHISDGLANGCSKKMHAARGMLDCLGLCRSDSGCTGVSMEGDHDCFVHDYCPSVTLCDPSSRSYGFLSKNCAHGGVWVPQKGKCQCTQGWVGSSCQELPYSPDDLISAGYPSKEDYRIYLNLTNFGLGVYPVLCAIISNTGYSNIGIFRHDGGLDFNRGWADYSEGFYRDGTNEWVGLRTWAALSQAGYNYLTVVMTLKSGSNLYREYVDFTVLPENQDFRFSFTSTINAHMGSVPFGASFGDCFGPYKGVPFSTLDNDRDGDAAANCARDAGSGWWFNGCTTPCNLFGQVPKHWTAMTPTSQKLSVQGIGQQVMATFFDSVSMYLKR